MWIGLSFLSVVRPNGVKNCANPVYAIPPRQWNRDPEPIKHYAEISPIRFKLMLFFCHYVIPISITLERKKKKLGVNSIFPFYPF